MFRKALCATLALVMSTTAHAASWQLSGKYGPHSSPSTVDPDRRQTLWLSVSNENGSPVSMARRGFRIQSVGYVGRQYYAFPATISEANEITPGVYRLVFTHDRRFPSVGGIVVQTWDMPSIAVIQGGGDPTGAQRGQLFLPQP
ncbi:MAG: hypothetical protein ABIS39_03035 [Sphingomicrobium sp.]